jgi:hypothetical protein
MKRYGGLAAVACGLALVAACSSGGITVRPDTGAESVRIGPYTQEFSAALAADSTRADVVQGFRQGQILWTRSEEAFRLVAPVREYVTGQALTHLDSAIQAGQSSDVVPAGTDRLFMTKVTSVSGSRAVITTCDDGSEFRQQNPHTGKVDASLAAQPQQEYLAETWRMSLLHGRWAIASFALASLPSQSAERCQPAVAADAPRPPATAALLKDMAAAMRDASSVHVSGTVDQDHQTQNLDLSMTRSGEVSGLIGQNSTQITVLVTGGQAYLQINPSLLRLGHLPASACKQFCGKYVRTSATQTPGLSGLDMSTFISQIAQSITKTPAAKVSFGGTIAFGTSPAWVLQEAQQQGTAFVAARGQPYLLQLSQPGQGAVTFSQWNAAHIPGPPPASKLVNPTQLGALAA